jgi:hypothetical protein
VASLGAATFEHPKRRILSMNISAFAHRSHASRGRRSRPFLLLVLLLLGTLAAFTASGCESRADVSNPKTFDSADVVFEYPSNWTVTTHDVSGGREYHVESPGDAILMVLVLDPPIRVDLKTFADSMSQVRAEEAQKLLSAGEMQLGEVGATESKMVDTIWRDGNRQAVQHNFVISALGEPVPHVALFHAIDSPTRTGFVMSQVASDDLEKVKPGFQLIWKTIQLK